MEMLPLARELFQRREAYQVVERLISDGSMGMCIFFIPGSSESIDGHCLYYSYRPTVCRLFGFAAWKNKRGIQEAALCKRQKEWSPSLVATTEDAISKGLNPPDYTHFSIRFSALDNKLMPINRAIHLAVERYGLRVQMTKATVVGRDSQHGGIHGSQAAVSFGKAA